MTWGSNVLLYSLTLADSDNYIRVLVEFAAEYASNNYL